jgi:DNA polymerase-3 subunit gamma/tau
VNQNHTDALVLLDEIMRKGFDGQQFIAGLSEHFRNLLFAKDSKTIALMELSEENRAKFQTQSANTSASFLLSAMNLCSQCEIHYKAAKNARLHVELTLLKINYLPSVYQPSATQPAVEGGAGKKSESKPIAKASVSEPKPEPMPEPEPKPEPTIETQAIRPISHGLRSAKKVVSLNQLENEAEAGMVDKVQQEPFSFEELNFVWTQIAQGFKTGNFINKFVMMNREISLIDSVIHLKVESEVQMQQFNDSLKLELVTQLRTKLKNDSIELVLDLIEVEITDKKIIYTQSDKYEFLSQKHPILVEMKQRMGLDYEF